MPKSGSTSLNQLLRKHDQIAIPRGEVHFFDRYYAKGLSYYEARLRKDCGSIDGKLLGDTTPGYAKSAEVAERIHKTVPDAKLVFCLRNPCDRLFSTYLHGFKKGKRNISFDEFVSQRMDVKRNGRRPFLKSSYLMMLEPYRALFPTGNICLILFEDIVGEHQAREINRLTDFLGVERFAEPQLPWENKTRLPVGLPMLPGLRKYAVGRRLADKASWLLPAAQPKPKMDPDMRKMLETYFAPMAAQLDEIWGTDASELWGLKREP